jgi:hypothetical protein
MIAMKAFMRTFALDLVRGACACACLLPLSCAFGDADAVQSLFEDNKDPLFVAVGMDTSGNYALYSSPTGSKWSNNLVRVAEPGNLNCAVYGNGLFITAGSPSNYYFSEDGVLWGRGSTSGGAVVDTLNDGVYGDGRFVVVGSNSLGKVVSYASEDGLFWIKGNLDILTGVLYGIAYANGTFVAVGSTTGSSLVVSSTDGIVWTGNLKTSPVTFYDVASGNGLFVAVGTGSMAAASPDGLVWTKDFPIGKDGININGITCGNGRFIAVGDVTGTGYSGIYFSDDGLAWSANVNRGSGGTSSLQDVTCCHGYFVAVSSSGVITYSPQGISWNTTPGTSGMSLYGITCRP